jgi:ligand-binding sensor domain-containing protein/two-component sensor histidine kinase
LRFFTLAFALAAIAAPAPAAHAERLPLRSFTTADGLAHDRVSEIVRDSRGFLWFCTAGGLSRFDGRSFVSYTADDGLPVHTLTHLVENPDGSYWIATNGGGLVRYDPAAALRSRGGSARFTSVLIADREPAANRVNVLYRGPAGRLWVGTDGGLFAHEPSNPQTTFQRIPLGAPVPDRHLQIWSVLEEPNGTVWVGTAAGLVRRSTDGDSTAYSVRPARGADHVFSLVLDRQRRLWIGHDGGLTLTTPAMVGKRSADGRPLWSTEPHLLEGTRVTSLLTSSDGHVWAASGAALYRIDDRGHATRYDAAHGFDGIAEGALAEDVDGNIWVGTTAAGAARIRRAGLTTYTTRDGLDHDAIGMFFETPDGRLCAISRGSRINVFDGRRFQTIVPNIPFDADGERADSYYALALLDRSGEWWIPSGATLYRFAAVRDPALLATVRPTAAYRLGEEPASRGIFRLFEDSRGDIWIARRVPSGDVLTRLERATGALYRYTSRDGLPVSTVTAFAEDRAGALWIGFWDAGLVRYREGRFDRVAGLDGAAIGGVPTLRLDRKNRLWVATGHGLLRVDDPGASVPRPIRYSAADGLVDSAVAAIAEDRDGRTYVGTRRGVNRLEANSGRIRLFTTDDGLAALETRAAFLDRHGSLWFSTWRGVSRLMPDPGPDAEEHVASALLQSVRIDGSPQPLPDLGTTEAGPLRAGSPGSRIDIEFFALSFRSGAALAYQFMLDGTGGWSTPSDQRSVTFPRLSPGTYRFSVRAVTSGGRPVGPPATLTFTIPPPVWAGWWFLAAAAAFVGLAIHGAYRSRLARLLEIERIRTRLAMDLHDDIGSTLSQVAVLSEVARTRAAADRRLTDLLERIADISRHLVDAMSDVVWAINPERDALRDLVQRMRRFASDTLDARCIRLRFTGPEEDLGVRLEAEVRREVFLIFKECINNLLRYAQCTSASVDLQVEGAALVLTIADDGIGADPLPQGDGLGLRSMRKRAERLGADFQFHSAAGKGTVVRLAVPLRRSAAKSGGTLNGGR